MLEIKDKKKCCGCEACVQRCPVQCISMRSDVEGFLYPNINQTICINCNVCEKVCPEINQSEIRRPLKVYAAKNPDELIRLSSSSGGIFTMLAEQILKENGVVFGARFNEKWEVEHGYTDIQDGVAAFRGSKYVQSRIGDNYRQVEDFLRKGRKVLFSGTPCQVAGLKRFLHNKEYDNLLTVDVVCHGVPSPLVWRKYLEETIRPKGVTGKNTVLSSLNTMPVITGISFRDKKLGWKKFGFEIRSSASEADENSVLKSGIHKERIYLYESLDKNLFMQGFLKNIYLRPSCYACSFRSGKSSSDITVADYWGIHRHYRLFDDDKGVGLVLVNTLHGAEVYSRLSVDGFETPYKHAFYGNQAMERDCSMPKYRDEFWKIFQCEGINAIRKICKKMRPGTFEQMIILIKRIAKQILMR